MALPGKFLIPATLAAGTIFATLTAPLAFWGSQQIEIHLGTESVFEGQLREMATPYLTFAGVLSLGATVASVAVLGWRQTARQSEALEMQLAKVEQQFSLKQAQLQGTRLSETYLRDSGLQFFLENDAAIAQPQAPQPARTTQAVLTAHPIAKSVAVLTEQVSSPSAAPTAKAQMRSQKTVLPSQAAQAVLSFSRSSIEAHHRAEGAHRDGADLVPAELRLVTAASPNSAGTAQVQELHSQLQQILIQIEGLQNSLPVNPQSAPAQLGSIQTTETTLNELTPRWQILDRSKAV
ncbi:hypothetical protein [Myxacorys almedinensis]|uniref:Uncharacterized protein n=1 Tax=Myxacorys almedinensis A TaxID=2690445 RepID=A0A8J7Z1R7_9CYAN|nr:hypothetical protein [Myxacorys almedinensis]NDJ16576.1 hypothetical protein [Myxacorys almedinensis A]